MHTLNSGYRLFDVVFITELYCVFLNLCVIVYI